MLRDEGKDGFREEHVPCVLNFFARRRGSVRTVRFGTEGLSFFRGFGGLFFARGGNVCNVTISLCIPMLSYTRTAIRLALLFHVHKRVNDLCIGHAGSTKLFDEGG